LYFHFGFVKSGKLAIKKGYPSLYVLGVIVEVVNIKLSTFYKGLDTRT